MDYDACVKSHLYQGKLPDFITYWRNEPRLPPLSATLRTKHNQLMIEITGTYC